MKKNHLQSPVEIKYLSETGVFEGYASVFDVTDSVNDQITPGAFKGSLEESRRAGRMPPLLWQHDNNQPIGAWREMYEDSRGLYVRGELFINEIARAKEAYKLLQENVVTGLSIGYRVKESHRDMKSGVRVLTALDLLEVSVVTFPANGQARVALVKSIFDTGHIPTEREFEAFLREAGLSRKQAKGVISHGFKSLHSSEMTDGAEIAPRDAADVDDSALMWLTGKIRSLT